MARPGSVVGGALLIAGSCIGAGMLALPVVTGLGGFGPAAVLFFFAWLFMATTGLLLLEANLALGYNHSLISLTGLTLGRVGKVLCWILFLFLFYSLSIAYIAASGSILQTICGVPAWMGSLLFTALFGIVIFIGTRPVDLVNRVLMAGLIITYCLLVLLGSFYLHKDYLTSYQWSYAFAAIPVLIISFGFHNMIPSLAMYFEGDRTRLRLIVFVGSFLPLLFYLIWEAIMLGIIPVQGREGLLAALDQGEVVTQALSATVGTSWINLAAQTFALFAIITSFLAQSLSLVDFLADGLKISKVGASRLLLVLLTLLPPLFFAYLYPGIFIQALNYASGFSAVILFGLFPALMVWKLRRQGRSQTSRVLLVVVLICALSIFTLELAQELGLSLLPTYAEAIP